MTPRDPNRLHPDPDLEDIDTDPDLPDPELEGPDLEQPDWDDLQGVGGEVLPDSLPENGDFRYDEDEEATEPLEEDDDNPYQDSDEALPDDDEEAAIGRGLLGGE